jgi:hypothetical protein
MSTEHRRGPMVRIERQGEETFRRLDFDHHATAAELDAVREAKAMDHRAASMQSPHPRAPRTRRRSRSKSTPSRGDPDEPPPALARAGSWLVDAADWAGVAS